MSSAIPSRDGELRDFGLTFSGKIAADPPGFGFTAGGVVPLTTAASEYSDAYNLVADPETKTRGVVADKDLKREILKAVLRSFIGQLQANPAITAQQKSDLGIPIHDREPSPIAAPASQPVLTVLGIVNDTDVVTRATDLLTGRRARPAGVAGTAYYTYVGENPPADIEQWRHEGLSGKSQFTCAMRPEDAGKLITIRARYYNAKGEFGPLSTPVTAVIAKVEAA